MNPFTYAVRGSNQIDCNGRGVNGRSVKKCNCKSHNAWSHSSLYQALSLKRKEVHNRYVAVFIIICYLP